MTRWLLPACLAAALLTAACDEPPNKEMDQAQGALDAARAAGADRYATEEYAAATDALTRSHQAVTERDYRLALNNALESREHAQNAAREAADTKARLRGDAERKMAEIAGLLAQANARLQAAEARRVPPRTLRQPQQALLALNADVQKAGEAMKADDYRTVGQLLAGGQGANRKGDRRARYGRSGAIDATPRLTRVRRSSGYALKARPS